MKVRLDQELVQRGLVATRSQAENYIRLGEVSVNGRVVTKPGYYVSENAEIELAAEEQFVSRAALKLKSVAEKLNLNFKDKVVLDVGSSTGGFTQFALSRGAKKVIAVDVGTDQLHPKLRRDPRIELHEKTDIRDVYNCHSELVSESSVSQINGGKGKILKRVQDDKIIIDDGPNLILIDVSFISLREILPHVAKNLADKNTQIVAMVKPQFETGARVKNAGVVKNDTERRKILKDFETWAKQLFIIKDKKDSEVAGATGNRERFYLLRKVKA
ncbi:TlyA family RNA methyltransferase [Candidatus Saccharibacteria bacterium]|nr:TlyA family RNA methyltransferase [Candidatus Saccharibacteria bacterium]